jgi:3-oxoacyl-[acyl-carrier-protein] synthase-3
MSATPRTKFVSFGKSLPKRVVTNSELEKYMETSDEWIQQRSGIKERRWVSEGETMIGMAKAASFDALKNGNLNPDDLDAIIFCSLISDYVFPGSGCLLQKELGCKKPIPALEIRNQCSAFLYALSIADAWIRTGFYKRILIVGAEIHSTSLDISTAGRDISVLFGDGAGAVIVEATNEPNVGVIDTFIAAEGMNAEKLYLSRPSPNDHPRIEDGMKMDRSYYPVMDGKFVFKNAILRMSESMGILAQRNRVRPEDVDFVIAHQANMRINQAVMEYIGMPMEKTHHTIDRYGNTTAATIPLTMGEAVELGKIKRGDLVALVAFGSGFTWGASLLRF